MAAPAHMHEGTQASGGFPPFKTETFPSQFFWLTITFVLLFVVMWRVAVPRIGGAIAGRKAQLTGDLAAAEQNRRDAEAASAAYDAALAAARARAQSVADENRRRINGEVEAAKAKADAEAHAAMAKAEASINATCEEAKTHVANAARDAAISIVSRLIGENVSADDAAAAIAASRS
ncbi:MAG TPA: hypothetical protein VGT78_00600 [Rhizomicrobium sp.]|nr:hypothetical protein [Rhizomicrobium sp.]